MGLVCFWLSLHHDAVAVDKVVLQLVLQLVLQVCVGMEIWVDMGGCE